MRIARPKKQVHRRQATFQLTFCGGGSQDVKPGICFRGKPKKLGDGTVDPKLPQSSILQKEKFPRGVNVYWQPKGYFDTATCAAYAKDYKRQAKRGEKLHQMDNLGGQSCPAFRKYMREEADTLIHFTPPDCTDLAAAVDAGLGKDIKHIVKRKFQEDFDERFDDWCDGKISARK